MHPMFVGFRTRDGKKKTGGTNQSAIEMTERPSAVKTEKSCPNPGHFVKHAKANKLEVTYGFNRFCANKEDTRHFYTTPQTQFIMEQFDPKNFNAFIDILRAGLELRQYTQDNSDDYHDVLRDLYDMDDRRKHSTLKGRLQVIKKYEAKLAEKAKKEAEREAKKVAKKAAKKK